MPAQAPSLRVAIYGTDPSSPRERHGCNLWPAGIAASLTYAGVVPVILDETPGTRGGDWEDLLDGMHGVVLSGYDGNTRYKAAEAETLVIWCQEHKFPLLGLDHGVHLINTAHGGTVHFDLPRDLPEALQHRHPPERGLRHAINVLPDTKLAGLYGDGEVVVNSEHRRAVARVARGFRVSAQALDGVIEAIEAENSWFALGVQWHPASATASGLDIQLFRGLVQACQEYAGEEVGVACAAA
jgi:gamma-glutamyl-gamma-aminobutyrate hydrolase PuuD